MISKIPLIRNLSIDFNKNTKKTSRIIVQNNADVSNFSGINSINNIAIQKDINNREYDKFLKRKGKVTVEEYRDIKENHPNFLIKALNRINGMRSVNIFKTSPKTTAKIALHTKKRYDSLYGKDNYTIVSIGTSPSFLMEAVKQLGSDVVFLPISDVRDIKEGQDIEENIKEYPNLSHCKNYLNNTLSEGKSIILLDYTVKGTTINAVENLIKKYCKIPNSNVLKSDLLEMLYSLKRYSAIKENNVITMDDYYDVEIDTSYQKAEVIGNIPHFSVFDDKRNEHCNYSIVAKDKTEEELFKEFEDFSRPSARAYQLLVLAELDKMGELK